MYGLPAGGFAGTQAAWESLLLAEDRAEAVRLVERAFDTGQPVEGEWRVTWPDGSVRWLMGRFQVFRDEAGAPARMTGVSIDITKRKHAEEAIRESDRRKDEFLATLAHELRNPLAPVRNAAHVLRMKMPPSPDLLWANDVLGRQLRSMTRLIDELIDVIIISRVNIQLRRSHVSLAQVVQDAVEAARPLIEQHGHELTVVLPPQPISLDADPTRLVQVFLNLLNNAAKFTAPGGRIDLTARRQGDDVVVSVKDTGLGIPAANLESVFEMFSQVEGALARSQGGLGIGLCLVKRLVELHGGHVKAKSPGLGEGSEFLVRLPTSREQSPACEPPDHNEGRATPTTRLRILVVDDNRDAADSLAMLLGLQGHEVRVAYSGEAAVEMTTTYAPDAVFLDIGMPGMNGYAVARRLRQQPGLSNVVLAALTGWGQQADRRRTAEAGFNHHLVKPPEFEAVERVLAGLERPDE